MSTQRQNLTSQVRDKNYDRLETAIKVAEFEAKRGRQSQRQFAKENNIPRTTLQYWLRRKESLDASPALIAFFESPDGLAFLHRLITAAHYVFTKVGVASIHNVADFLKRCELEPFVACSYFTQWQIAQEMDEEIIKFGSSESYSLAQQMPSKAITLLEDETFHPEICLVAIEAVSNYIILEKYVEKRDGETWNKSVKEALAGLPVEVIQVTSDEGSGLLNHVKNELKVHHSSDLFHVTQEVGRGTSGPLASEIKRAEKLFSAAEKQTEKIVAQKQKFDEQEKRPRGRRPDFDKKIAIAEEERKKAEIKLKEARENQETVRAERKNIGRVYHPFDPLTGVRQDAQTVEKLLNNCFSEINKATYFLSKKSRKHLEKAFKVVTNFVATIAFFWAMVEQHLENSNLTEEEEKIIREHLLPGYCLALVAEKEKDEVRNDKILFQSKRLLSIIRDRDGTIEGLSSSRTAFLIRIAQECAHFFQRSSSSVEGRNGQLSLRHHGIHRLSDKHLQAQTVIHNFHTRRKDNTTPAERLFEAKHGNLFEHLLDRMDYPARPRKRLAKAA